MTLSKPISAGQAQTYQKEEFANAKENETGIGCHTFWATGITAYLENGGRLEVA